MAKAWKYLSDNWERLLFGLVGLACLVFGFRFIADERITSASAVFAIGFFSFLYSNLARFKRFKGLGFEAELWEDKQKEAAELIDRLKNVVAIYTREIVMTQVLRGRLSSGTDWKKNWALYDELVNQHDALGQQIDFSALKAEVDRVFLFDMCNRLFKAARQPVEDAKTAARALIDDEFGSPVRDIAGHNARNEQFNAIAFESKDMFERAGRYNIAQEILDQAREVAAAFQRDFAVKVDFEPEVIEKLERVARWYDARPLQVTDEMIAIAQLRQTTE